MPSQLVYEATGLACEYYDEKPNSTDKPPEKKDKIH
jgi:hypothetical protein